MNSKILSLQHFYAFFAKKVKRSLNLLKRRCTKGLGKGPVDKTGP